MEHNRIVYEKPYDAEIEYLESTGTQYIDTAVYGSNNSKVELDLQLLELGASKAVFGCYSANQASLYMYQAGGDSNGKWQFGFGWNANCGQTDTNRHLIICENFDLTIDGSLIFSHNQKTFITPHTMLLFNMHNNSGGIYSATGIRIFSCKLYNNSILVRDFIPVRKGSIGYLYDKVSKKLFANKGTDNFILGQDISNPVPNIRRVFRFDNKRFVMPMPYDRRVEYLESTGTQYIDTGVIIDSETAFAGTSVDFQAVNINNGTCVIAGSVLSEGANRYKNLNLLVYNNKFYIDGAGWRFNNNVNDITLRTIATATGTAKGISRKQFLLFARYVVGLGATTSNSGCRIFSCKIYKNEILICDLIPVRKDNVGYMYDCVSCRLFGNAGTGQFILGNDIND